MVWPKQHGTLLHQPYPKDIKGLCLELLQTLHEVLEEMSTDNICGPLDDNSTKSSPMLLPIAHAICKGSKEAKHEFS